MNWIQSLYETYENCQNMIGIAEDESKVPLLPICHTTQKATIEITLDGKGNFRRAPRYRKRRRAHDHSLHREIGRRTSGEASTSPLRQTAVSCRRLQNTEAKKTLTSSPT